MFRSKTGCFPRWTSDSLLDSASSLGDEPFDHCFLSDSIGLSALNGHCSTTFQNNLINIINNRISTAKPKGTGMSRDMKVDLDRGIKFFVGNELVDYNCNTKEKTLERWNSLVSDDRYRWVKDNIEALSTFLHQGFLMDIYTAQNMTGGWLFHGKNIKALGLSNDFCVLYKICPEQVIRIIITANVTNIFTNNDFFTLEDSTCTNFSVKLTLRFKVIDTKSGASLQACFTPNDSFKNLWYVKTLPTIIEQSIF